MLTRGSLDPVRAAGIRTRLLATRAVSPSTSPVAHTASTASSVPPPVNTHRRRNNIRSGSSSSS